MRIAFHQFYGVVCGADKRIFCPNYFLYDPFRLRQEPFTKLSTLLLVSILERLYWSYGKKLEYEIIVEYFPCGSEAWWRMRRHFPNRSNATFSDKAPNFFNSCNPLDFHFSATAQKEVYSQKPETIDSLIECVRGFA